MLNPQLRLQLNVWLEKTALKLNLKEKKILEIGIGGDEKPSGAYKFFGKGNEWKTMDISPKWKPDIVADITNNNLLDNSIYLVIMTQTLEHIWDYKKALSEIYRITNQYAIIDCPFMYSFHSDLIRKDNDWNKWDDYWRFTPPALKRLLEETGFKIIDLSFKNELNTQILCQK